MNQMIKKIYPVEKNFKYKIQDLYLNPIFYKHSKAYRPLYYANFLSSFDGRIATYNKKNKLTPEQIQEEKEMEEQAAREDKLIEDAKKGIILPGRTSPILIPKPTKTGPFRGGRLRRSRRSKTVSGKRSAKTKKRKTRTRRGRKCNCKNKCKCIRNTRKSRKR